MYVCICNAVTRQEVGAAIEAGARTRDDVTRACHAGGDCGACHSYIEEMISERTGDSLLPAAHLVREHAA